MSSGLTAIKIGETTFPIDFSQHNHDDRYITKNVTYTELVELRNNSQLTPGRNYRITDYVTTTNQLNVSSAGHQFDIIVEALDDHTLSENASAVKHEGDTYFETEHLEAWQLKYCLDNDTSRFAWAKGTPSYKTKLLGNYTNDPDPNNAEEYAFDKDWGVYEWSIESHPDTGDDIVVIYCQDPMYYDYGADVDYNDPYYYNGVVEIDGVEYDSWKKYDDQAGEWVFDPIQEGQQYLYTLTKRIVYNNEVIWPEFDPNDLGKGVIYNMIDEYGNECPYDFKNILFYQEGLERDVYTFTWIDDSYNVMDTSVFGNNGTLTLYGETIGVYDNVIKPYMEIIYDENSGDYIGTKQSLNWITFISDYTYQGSNNEGFSGCHGNSFGDDCFNNSFGNECHNNSFGNNCYGNSFGNECRDNSFGNECRDNSFGTACYINSFGYSFFSNSFGDTCYGNSFGNDCYGNSFGNNCDNNSFGNNCDRNSFGYYCDNNSFGNYCVDNSFRGDCNNNSFGDTCSENSFGDTCYGNFFGNKCSENSFGNDFQYNSFGNYCNRNSFGNDFQYNSFGNDCSENSFGEDYNYNSFGNGCYNNSFRADANENASLLSYVYYNHFDDGCSNITIHCGDWQNVSAYGIKNLHVTRGCSNINVDIQPDCIGAEYEIKVAKNSSGEIKIYCEADLIA